MENALLIGCGAMGRMVMRQLACDTRVRIACILEAEGRRDALQRELGNTVTVISDMGKLPAPVDFALECAGHGALCGVVPALLERGIDTIVASVGALAEPGRLEALESAATAGNAQLTLVSGAIPGIDALSAAALAQLESVTYIGRKPPTGWSGTAAENIVDLRALQAAAIIFEGSAREAAMRFPKNANVAAMVALAGIGMDRTRVQLIADPDVTRNTHRLHALGEFGELDVTIMAHPLADNPKTSALAAYSIVRAVQRRVERISM